MSSLFSPFSIGRIALPNRIVIAPMCQYSAEEGNANDWHLMHYGKLALSGAGLLIVEATGVEREGRITPGCLGLWNDANEAALQRVDQVIAVSTDDRDRMVEAGVDHHRITVIPHGVDAVPFRGASGEGLRERYGISEDAPLLFFHGTLDYWPNTEAVRFLVEQLLPRLLRSHPDTRILVCGRNPPAYYAHPAVVLAGSVEDLPAHVAAADVCVCPVFAGGGTRMKLLEYMAAGQAVHDGRRLRRGPRPYPPRNN